jgi:hypothetical protein
MTIATPIEQMPTSFGALKPTGHVLLALKARSQKEVLETALLEAGWADDAIAEFSPRETVAELTAMVDKASGLAGFGSELTLMRRYLQLARVGHCWLLVRVDNDEQALRIGQLARLYGASAAVHYRTFTIEDLL